jgi:hypothetical protein
VKLTIAAIAMILATAVATAQDGVTVQALLSEGYEIKGVMPSSAGPGILLQKGDQLVMCFVAETPQSAELTTQYCKPVK